MGTPSKSDLFFLNSLISVLQSEFVRLM
jgi:hypothetical protein